MVGHSVGIGSCLQGGEVNPVAAYIVAFVTFYVCVLVVLWAVDEVMHQWTLNFTELRSSRSELRDILAFGCLISLVAAAAQAVAKFLLFLLTL